MIRPAIKEDINDLVVLGREMHEESRFAGLTFSEEKVRHLLAHLIDDPNGCLLVSEKDGVIIGGFAGFISEHYFSTDKVANDFALFIGKADRGGMSAALLLRSFVKWAKKQGAALIQVGITTGVHVEESTRLYNALGFKTVGPLFAYEGKH